MGQQQVLPKCNEAIVLELGNGGIESRNITTRRLRVPIIIKREVLLEVDEP
jgi:hypothetical protein